MAKRVESPSSINTFKQCTRKYYYQYIAKIPTLPNIHQVRGNIAHATLEKFYDLDPRELTQETFSAVIHARIQTLFVQQWSQYQPPLKGLKLSSDQERFYFEETMLMLMNWANQFIVDCKAHQAVKNLSFAQVFTELTPLREQKFQSDHYSVQGFVDAIHQIEDQVHIIDYKTNSSLEVKDSIKLQLAIYSLLYFEKYGKIPSKVGIFFLRHKLKMMDADEQLLELARREIELVHKHTSRFEAIEDYPRCTGPLCKWSTGKCDFFEVCKPFEK